MYIDFKITMWERIHVPNGIEDELVNKIKSGEITSTNECYGVFGGDIDNHYELLLDTSEDMSPEENSGFPTIEIHTDPISVYEGDEIIWDNGRKEPINV